MLTDDQIRQQIVALTQEIEKATGVVNYLMGKRDALASLLPPPSATDDDTAA